MFQEYTSKDTSINSSKLPAIYNKINWNLFKNGKVLDIGAGKFIDHIISFLKKYSIKYFPYDRYNIGPEINRKSLAVKPDIIICSNVLNVIKENEIVAEIHNLVRSYNKPYFITVYNANHTGIGKPTKNGYQRNQRLKDYLYIDEVMYKNTITMNKYTKYLKKG